jgi:prepilin-type N-terminal cleavage/methylation domain-containing protein
MPTGRTANQSKSSGRRPGFTLLELIIVVGIVTVLVGLLVPAMSRVRETSRRTTDVSNLRQLATASISYAQENDGAFPPGRLSSPAPDDYTWLNYATCWKPLVMRNPGLAAITSCVSVREGYSEAYQFGQPSNGSGYPDDIQVGWVYWGGRDDLPAGGVPGYRSLHRLGARLTPGSQTLWTCLCWDSNGNPSSSVCPHVGSRYVEYPSGVKFGVTFKQPPDGLGVALADGSASFVPWNDLVIIPQANGFKLYYQP